MGERDAVEVLHIVELLNDFQVGLEVLYLGSKILGNFLYQFVTGEEVKNLVDVALEGVNAAELLD